MADAAVRIRQEDDGEITDDRVIVPPVPAREWLVVKAESHERHGWTVTWEGEDRFLAFKARGNDPRSTRREFQVETWP